MLRDQEIYKQVSAILYKGVPDNSRVVNAAFWMKTKSHSSTYWYGGGKLDKNSSFKFPLHAQIEAGNLLKELQDFYIAEKIGVWNVVYCVFDPSEKNINFKFDEVDDLESGVVTFHKYCVNRFG